MHKLIAFLILFLPSVAGFASSSESVPCTCPNVSGLQKTSETSTSITYSWGNAYTGAQYKVWYVRHSDGYNSGFFYTNNLSYSFTNLAAGQYTFYFQTLCGEEASGYIGIEDLIG